MSKPRKHRYSTTAKEIHPLFNCKGFECLTTLSIIMGKSQEEIDKELLRMKNDAADLREKIAKELSKLPKT
jgi:hypothetical protein